MSAHEHTQPRCYTCHPLTRDETRLIAAAPVLLEALEEIANDGSCECHTYIARAAIRQANGENT